MRIPSASTQTPFARPLRLDAPENNTPRTMRNAREDAVFEHRIQMEMRLERRLGAKAPRVLARLRELKNQIPENGREMEELKRQLNLPESNPRHRAAVESFKRAKRARLEQARLLRESGMNEEAMEIEAHVERVYNALLAAKGGLL